MKWSLGVLFCIVLFIVSCISVSVGESVRKLDIATRDITGLEREVETLRKGLVELKVRSELMENECERVADELGALHQVMQRVGRKSGRLFDCSSAASRITQGQVPMTKSPSHASRLHSCFLLISVAVSITVFLNWPTPTPKERPGEPEPAYRAGDHDTILEVHEELPARFFSLNGEDVARIHTEALHHRGLDRDMEWSETLALEAWHEAQDCQIPFASNRFYFGIAHAKSPDAAITESLAALEGLFISDIVELSTCASTGEACKAAPGRLFSGFHSVGCALAFCKDGSRRVVLFSCHYA